MVVTTAGTWLVFFKEALAAGRSGSTIAVLGAVLLAWLATAIMLGLHGFFEPRYRARVPHIALGFVPIVAGVAACAAFKPLRHAVNAVRPHLLIGVQAYRILGSVFLVFLAQRRLPAIFALPAGVGDLLVGVTAPLVVVPTFAVPLSMLLHFVSFGGPRRMNRRVGG
ncbi:MAG: hypothetical protein ABSF77_03595 [Spirochaetia bacterium]|jgi:hypothetical protein